jgi:CRISPR-associated endonuclease Cas1
VVIGSDGEVSLAALRWLADQNASFVMLDRDGSVTAITGPVRSSDVRLRRAQALALENGAALRVSRDLVDRKLAGQERVAMHDLANESVALSIRQCRTDLAEAFSIDAVRLVESQAAKAYWSAWRNLPIIFPNGDMPRVPDHWRTFGSRVSSLTGSPRLATNPPNAILNYLYAILEAEARLAAATLGLDPGIGVLHVDTPYRDSLACDLMEPIRPEVDAYVLKWLNRDPLLRNNFFEERNGNCRLMAPFVSELSLTAPSWARSVAPVAEWFAHEILRPKSTRKNSAPARLTQRYRREVKGANSLPPAGSVYAPKRTCRGCGAEITYRSNHCKACAKPIIADQITEAARAGRVVALEPAAQQKRAATQTTHARARSAWKAEDQPAWLTAEFYKEKVLPNLASVSAALIASRLSVSYSYADDIRKGRIPHARHWRALVELAGALSL